MPSLSSLTPVPGGPGRHGGGATGHAAVAGTRSVEAEAVGHAAGREGANGTPAGPPPVPSHALPATPEAFDALYVNAAPRLTWQTYLLTLDRRRAAHCVRRSFQLAWSDWPTVSADPSPEGWLRAAAFDLALSPWHEVGPNLRHALQLPHLPRLPHPGAKAVTPADTTTELPLPVQDRALLKAMAQLPDAQRRALVLHDVIGLDWAQTAAEVEGSTPVTFGRVARARRALARSVPGIVGADPEVPGFGRRLGERLRETARRACAEPARHGKAPAPATSEVAPGRITRARARLHDRGLTLAAGALTLATAGFLGVGLVWGTPMHPAEQPVVPHPTRATVIGTAGNATTDDIQPPKVPAPPLTPFTTGPGLVQQSPGNSGDSRKSDKGKGAKNAAHPAAPADSHGSGDTNPHPQHGHPHQPPAKKHH